MIEKSLVACGPGGAAIRRPEDTAIPGGEDRSRVRRVHDQQLDIREGDTPADPTLTLRADADDWLAIENGELNPMMAMMQGKVKLKGSIPFATKFMSIFGYGG